MIQYNAASLLGAEKWALNFTYSWETNYSGLLPLPVICWLTRAALYKIKHKELENICAFGRAIRDRLILIL